MRVCVFKGLGHVVGVVQWRSKLELKVQLGFGGDPVCEQGHCSLLDLSSDLGP